MSPTKKDKPADEPEPERELHPGHVDPLERTEPEVFDAGEQPEAELVETEDDGPDVWQVSSPDGTAVVGGSVGTPPEN